VAIIDLDPQASAALWASERTDGPEAVTIPPAMLDKLLASLRENGTELVVIDTPREANNAGFIAAQVADLVLAPLRRGGFDFRALKRTLDLCRLAEKRPYLLLNGVRPGAHRLEADALDTLATQDCDVAPVVIHQRAAYETASITALTVQEAEPDGAAAAEIGALFLWFAGQVGLSTTRRAHTTRQHKKAHA
jgi:chromosome partitioning protein